MKISSNFQLEEFVHPDIYNVIGSRSLDFLHPLLPLVAQQLRDAYGPITINNWLWGGERVNSGLRFSASQFGTRLSSHKFGCAIDCLFKDTTPIDVQKDILSHNDYPHITRMENAEITKTWAHIEVGQRNGDIKVFNP